MSASAVYEGWVRHRRFEPVEHEFRYRHFLMYLDLAELPRLLDPYPLWSGRRAGERPAGPVRLLAGLRYLGHSFNPVSFYYCFDSAGERVQAVVADVENIPWGERHAYVLARGDREGPVLSEELDKTLHVSPLMGMDQTYGFRASEPGARLAVHIESRPERGARPGEERAAAGGAPKSFDATLSLRRRELSRPLLLGLLARYPAMSLQVVAKIYAQSLRLKLKGARYFPHPRGSKPKGFVSP